MPLPDLYISSYPHSEGHICDEQSPVGNASLVLRDRQGCVYCLQIHNQRLSTLQALLSGPVDLTPLELLGWRLDCRCRCQALLNGLRERGSCMASPETACNTWKISKPSM